MRFFGIDLGTSKCSVSYAVNSHRPNVAPQPVTVEFVVDPATGSKSSAVSSSIARSATGSAGAAVTLYGAEAERALQNGQVRGRNCQNWFRSVKSHLGTGRSYVRADASLNTPVKVWASLIRRLCEMTVAEKGDECFDPRKHPTVLTVPASFGKAQRDETIEAARQAGFSVSKDAKLVRLIDEPVAALIDTLNHADIDLHIDAARWNTVLVFDFGGGTCDLTLLKFRYDASDPTGIDCRPQAISPYQQIGGDTIDLAIMHEVVWPQLCHLNDIHHDIAGNERKEVEDTLRYSVCRRLKELVNHEICKRQHELLDRKDWSCVSVELPLGGRGCRIGGTDIGGTATLTGDALYQIMLPFIDTDPLADPFVVGESNTCVPFATLVETTMTRAGMSPDALDLLVLHGRSCKSPFVRLAFDRMKDDGVLAGRCKILSSPDPTASVARGAALSGCLSKKYGKPYIQAIVPEDLSVRTVDGTLEPMVHAATQLPLTAAKTFRTSTPGQREMVVPILVGHDDTRVASTLKIPISQKNLPQSHPIEVELTIDHDKDSRWRFRPKGYDWSEAYEVANCWIASEPTKETIRLQETRATIRSAVDAGTRPQARLLMDEALHAARAGFTEEGLCLIEDVLDEYEASANAWNVKGLIYSLMGNSLRSLACYENATLFGPDVPTFRGNYGVALARNDRHQKAVVVMREALSIDPSLTYLHSWLADSFQSLQDFDEMNKELEMAFLHAKRESIRTPDDVSSLEEVRRAALRIGRYDEADEAAAAIRETRRIDNLLASDKHG